MQKTKWETHPKKKSILSSWFSCSKVFLGKLAKRLVCFYHAQFLGNICPPEKMEIHKQKKFFINRINLISCGHHSFLANNTSGNTKNSISLWRSFFVQCHWGSKAPKRRNLMSARKVDQLTSGRPFSVKHPELRAAFFVGVGFCSGKVHNLSWIFAKIWLKAPWLPDSWVF